MIRDPITGGSSYRDLVLQSLYHLLTLLCTTRTVHNDNVQSRSLGDSAGQLFGC